MAQKDGGGAAGAADANDSSFISMSFDTADAPDVELTGDLTREDEQTSTAAGTSAEGALARPPRSPISNMDGSVSTHSSSSSASLSALLSSAQSFAHRVAAGADAAVASEVLVGRARERAVNAATHALHHRHEPVARGTSGASDRDLAKTLELVRRQALRSATAAGRARVSASSESLSISSGSWR